MGWRRGVYPRLPPLEPRFESCRGALRPLGFQSLPDREGGFPEVFLLPNLNLKLPSFSISSRLHNQNMLSECWGHKRARMGVYGRWKGRGVWLTRKLIHFDQKYWFLHLCIIGTNYFKCVCFTGGDVELQGVHQSEVKNH